MNEQGYEEASAVQAGPAPSRSRRRIPHAAAPRIGLSQTGHHPCGLDPHTVYQIHCKAGQLIGKAGLTRQDREDLEQDLTARLLTRLSGFDERRASRRTFVSRLLDSCAASLLMARRASKRDWRRDVCSLSEIVTSGEGEPIELLDLLEQESGSYAGDGVTAAQVEGLALRIDLERVLATLAEKEREACRLLTWCNPYQAARRMGMAQATFYDLMGRVRAAFAAAGLKIYL